MVIPSLKKNVLILRNNVQLITIVTTYVILLSTFTIERYKCFLTNAYDLGIYNQAFWTTLHGKLFYETPDLPLIPSGSFLGVHFAPLIFFLLPLYAIYPSPVTLLIIQTIAIALGAIPIYLIGFEVLKSRGRALVFSALYLSYPVIHSLNIYDFHIESFLPLFLLSFYYCYLKRKWLAYWIFFSFSVITIDFAPVIIVAMSLTSIFSNKKEVLKVIYGIRKGKLGNLEKSTLMALLSVPVSVASFFLILQASILFSGKTNDVVNIISGFLNPARREGFSEWYIYFLQFWLFMSSNLLFTPLFEPLLLLMTGPWFLVTAISPNIRTYYILGYQYGGAFVAPFLFIASIHGAKRLFHDNRKNWFLAFIVMFTLSALTTPLNPLTESKIAGIAYEGYPRRTAHTTIIDQVLNLIPQNASVYTVNNLFPQLSNRDHAYIFLSNETDIEYTLVDTKSRWYEHRFLLIEGSSMSENLPRLITGGDFGIIAYIDGVILLKKGYTGEVLIFERVSYVYDYKNLALHYGSEATDPTSTSGVVLTHRPIDPIGTFWFGPYVSLIPGNYTVTFKLKVENITVGPLLTLQVTRKTGSIVLASLEVKGSDFEHEMTWQNFTLSFNISQEVARSLTDSKENLEFMGIAPSSGSTLYLDYIEVSPR